MNRFLTYCLCFLLLASACTNARWMVKDNQTVDPSDYRELYSRQFPVPTASVSPEDPILRLQLLSETTLEYSEKVLMARYIQDYKLRPVFFTLGLMGAGVAFYLANSNSVSGVDGRLETITLNTAGGIIALASFLNFKTSGDPRPTGEERFLRRTGTVIRTDTSQVTGSVHQDSVLADIYYGNTPVMLDRNFNISEGLIEIDLGSAVSELEITDPDPDSVTVNVDFADTTYRYTYALSSILRPFARVETPVTELRNSPEETDGNVLAELVKGSQLQIVEEVENDWYKVLYGISENYVSINDVVQVWRTSDFAQQNRVVAVPTVPFGNIDVENNIPILVSSNSNGVALLIGNEEHTGNYPTRKYTDRDLRLIRTYLTNALGYPDEHIRTVQNFRDVSQIESAVDSLRQITSDSSDVFVYLSGYGMIQQDGEDYMPYFLPSSPENRPGANLINLYNAIAGLPSRSTFILNDLDFGTSGREDVGDTGTLQPSLQPLYNAATLITAQHPDLSILFSCEIEQHSNVYLGSGDEDKKHHIFPYFFAKALQDRITVVSQIFRYLQRNVSYTSRKIHDEPQDPLMFGNESIDLAGE